MPFQRFYQLISRKLSSEATPEELMELEHLLAENNDLKSLYDNLITATAETEEDLTEAQQAFALHSTKIFLQTEQEPKPVETGTKRRFSLKQKAVYAFSFAILLVACGLLAIPYLTGKKAGGITYNTIEVPVGQRVKVTLPDGSVVWLNAKSKFTFPSSFDGDRREVQLDGEGYFDVAHNPAKPFSVNTPAYRINVLGTVFNVNAYSGSNTFETTLVSGSVKVDEKNNSVVIATLKPGEKFSFNRKQASYGVSHVDTQNYTTWKEGLYQFNSVPFGEMINELQHYKDVKIIVKDSSILNIICTGKFRERESIEEIINVIKTDIPFSYTYDKKNNTLYLLAAEGTK